MGSEMCIRDSLLRGVGAELPWQEILAGVSALAMFGGMLMMWLVPDGPNLPKGAKFNPRTLSVIFRSASFRSSAYGYFGHMWELYALWAFIPLWFSAYAANNDMKMNVSLWAFVFIGVGFAGCVVGGMLSRAIGSARVAAAQLLISGLCCLISPLIFDSGWLLFTVFALIWGVTVIGDSPQFSALNAENAPREYVGSALTIVNSIGFFVTVVSIQLTGFLLPLLGAKYVFWMLLPGPILGLVALRPLLSTKEQTWDDVH